MTAWKGRVKGTLMVLGAATAWGLMGTVARYLFTAEEVGPLPLTAIRSSLAVLILVAGLFVWDQRHLRLPLQDVPLAALAARLYGLRLVHDPLASRYETKILDWKRWPPSSLRWPDGAGRCRAGR